MEAIRVNRITRGNTMMTQTNEYTEYRINKELKLTIWTDKKLSISLLEDTVDLDPYEVKKLERVIGKYNVHNDIRNTHGVK